jgi:DNA-directed RNA polymerase specialized sigma24 family protein
VAIAFTGTTRPCEDPSEIAHHRDPSVVARVERAQTDLAAAKARLHACLVEALIALPTVERDAVRCCYFEGLTIRAAAERLGGCAPSTIHARLRRAERRLAKSLREFQEEVDALDEELRQLGETA